jgi:hypothetical protein
LTRTPSFLAEATIAGEDDLERLLAIRNNVFMARNTAAAAVEARLEVVSTRARLVAAEQMAPADPTLVTQVNSELTTASGKYNDARKDFDVALDQAVRAVTHPGVLVIRWQTNDSGSTGGSIGDLLGFGASHDITTSGFAILSGLRVTTLFVGPEVDSLEPGIKRTIDWGWYPWLDVIPWFWRRAYCGVRVTTCVLQAKHILYLQDADILRTSEVNLKASYEQLASLGETLREIDKIEIRSIQQRLDSLSNLGIVGNIERKVYPATLGEAMTAPVIVKDTNWLHEVAEQVTGASERVGTVQDSQGWHTVYVVDVDLSALQRLYDGEGGQEGDPD